jgi:hypothetical protein
MTSRYIWRLAFVFVLLAAALAGVLWFKPNKIGPDKWHFYRIGQANGSPTSLAASLQFSHVGQPNQVDGLASLPSSLAYVSKKGLPLFGQREPALESPVEMIVEPGKCLLVRSVRLISSPVDVSEKPRVLLAIDEASRQTVLSARLPALLPSTCAAVSYGPECAIAVWIEARPKKCN